ncbi:uncharacterized protein GGS22DRAFT_51387 [Annulohypoxylon maeteangense]|uniref:uncharacterized protein n=1 Tax=Annulohypoxylon maeteangense TaxID=1927788 RepID=UPI0020085A59|nr:uncharacterized protein GGS22DRAFT_51387 [Annulohypoxylon maeteangense]KAI0881844.1 hypothetical protein GGS22DRAFT_51387 [Annulohypoxylon maeteangense]
MSLLRQASVSLLELLGCLMLERSWLSRSNSDHPAKVFALNTFNRNPLPLIAAYIAKSVLITFYLPLQSSNSNLTSKDAGRMSVQSPNRKFQKKQKVCQQHISNSEPSLMFAGTASEKKLLYPSRHS